MPSRWLAHACSKQSCCCVDVRRLDMPGGLPVLADALLPVCSNSQIILSSIANVHQERYDDDQLMAYTPFLRLGPAELQTPAVQPDACIRVGAKYQAEIDSGITERYRTVHEAPGHLHGWRTGVQCGWLQ